MRISDWSSDVCSSDLALEQAEDGSWERIGVARVYYLGGFKAEGQAIFDEVLAGKHDDGDAYRIARVYREAVRRRKPASSSSAISQPIRTTHEHFPKWAPPPCSMGIAKWPSACSIARLPWSATTCGPPCSLPVRTSAWRRSSKAGRRGEAGFRDGPGSRCLANTTWVVTALPPSSAAMTSLSPPKLGRQSCMET